MDYPVIARTSHEAKATRIKRVKDKALSSWLRTISFWRAIYVREHWWAEFWSGAVLIVFAILDMTSPTPISMLPRWFTLTDIMPHLGWDLLSIGLGALQILSLIFDGKRVASYGRLASAVMATWFFTLICISIVLSQSGIPAGPIALVAGWVALNMFATMRETKKFIK